MTRIIACAALLTALLSGVAAAQTQPTDQWDAWIAAVQPLVPAKEEGIQNLTEYENQVCPLQVGEKKKVDCVSNFDGIIGRRMREKTLLNGMLNALTKLDRAEGAALVEIANPVFQRMDAETSDMAKRAFARFPRQQAAK